MAYVSTADLAHDVATAASRADDGFRIGRVFSRTTAVLSRNFPTFFAVATAAALPNVLVSQSGLEKMGTTGAALMVAAVILAMMLGVFCKAIIFHGAFQDLRGAPVKLGPALRAAASRIMPLIGLTICATLGVFIGVVLLIVPGIILSVMWFVAAPVCVVERKGPLASLGRSAEITRGHRWAILGVSILLGLAAVLVTGILEAVLGQLGDAVAALGTLIWDGAWGAFYAVFLGIIYHDLRVAKEGIDTHQIAAVFN
jgi:hypothetical protein